MPIDPHNWVERSALTRTNPAPYSVGCFATIAPDTKGRGTLAGSLGASSAEGK